MTLEAAEGQRSTKPIFSPQSDLLASGPSATDDPDEWPLGPSKFGVLFYTLRSQSLLRSSIDDTIRRLTSSAINNGFSPLTPLISDAMTGTPIGISISTT